MDWREVKSPEAKADFSATWHTVAVMKTTSNHAAARGFTTNAPTFAGNVPQGIMPASSSIAFAAFLSLPKPGARCLYSNLSRTTLCELGERGLIKILSIKKPGATRGKRLILKESLAAYLHSLANSGEGS